MLVLDEAVFMVSASSFIHFNFFWGPDGIPLILCRYDVAMFLTHRFLSSGEAVSLRTMTFFSSCIMIYHAFYFFRVHRFVEPSEPIVRIGI